MTMKTKAIQLVLLWLVGVIVLADSTKKDNSNENNNNNLSSNKPSNTAVDGENDGETEKFYGIDKNQYKE